MAHAIPKFVPDSVPLDIPLDAAAIAERGVLRHPRGGVLSRLGGMATLYFRQGSAPEVRRTVHGILADYLAAYGATITSYQRADERRLRGWDGRGLPQCYVDTAEATDPASRHYVKMTASGEGDSDPCLSLFWSSCFSVEDEGFFKPLSVIRLHVPPAVLLDAPDAFAARLADWAGRLPLVHGTAGLGALSSPGYEDRYAAWWLWLEAYPALEYDAAGRYLSEVRSALRDRSGGEWKPRSSNWLTFLGPQAVEALGGAGPMRSALGPRPALGSAATCGIPEAYRQVARLIAPIRFEDYAYAVIAYPDRMAPDRAARRGASERSAGCAGWTENGPDGERRRPGGSAAPRNAGLSAVARGQRSTFCAGRMDAMRRSKAGRTPMQAHGEYREIARDLGLEPRTDVREFRIPEECNCGPPTS